MRKFSFKKFVVPGLMIVGCIFTYQACNKASESALEKIKHALGGGKEIKQPMAFDHQAHFKAEEMECTDCHRFAAKSVHATLPKLKDCADCHSEPQGKNPEEAKVRKYLEEEKEIPWILVNRLPGHVYFSHKAHVGYAEMKCWECHRDMRKVSEPVTKPDIGQLTMHKCMECHKEKGVGLDCLKCHK